LAQGDDEATRADDRQREFGGAIKKTASGRRRSASSREASAAIKELLVSTNDGREFFGDGGKRWRSGSGRRRAASGKDLVCGSGQPGPSGSRGLINNAALAGHDNGWTLLTNDRALIRGDNRELTGEESQLPADQPPAVVDYDGEHLIGSPASRQGDKERKNAEKFSGGGKELQIGDSDPSEPDLMAVGRHKWSQNCPSALEVLDDL
jgi:hypothetical protein